ncbi:hypothetical protein GH714_011695 [Hevea brasiliensis]|uniref:Non-structural maintenance of chromosomes element 4 n=1 Tax=Hevea brasiliensis TaxID=3981 RepID=A0A6A6KBI2_HEVBR|nr:hypothetical protein GH714_011695 [Hevea brasiliensis]
MGRALNREPTNASNATDRQLRAVKREKMTQNRVQKPREQVADAEALLGLANTLVSSVKSQSNEGITAADFVSCVLSEFGQSNGTPDEGNFSSLIKWKEIGLAVSSIFRKCNGFSTMVGPMNTELKQRKTTVGGNRKRARPTERSQPEEVDDTGAEEKTDTDNNMSIMFEILRRNKWVRLENLILNRRNAPAANSVMSGEATYRHFVFRIDFKDWQLMMDVVSDGDELMPDRKSSATSELEPATNIRQETHNRTPIRKFSRNRGLVVQEDSVVEESPEIEATKAIGSLRCRRRLT